MNPSLLARVTAALDHAGIRYAVIGAGALAAHGIARSTFDLDLFTTDRAALDDRTWTGVSSDTGVTLEIRTGDSTDPLAGLVRLSAAGERDIDVVVGRSRWQAAVVERAVRVVVHGVLLPIVTPADLVLLKLYAGGSQDRWDIEQVLALADRDVIIESVSARIAELPPDCQAAWARFVPPAR
jgi:predicted nucleotidyltransferase